MADPKLQLDQRLDRIELAIVMMAYWLVEARTGFSAKDAENIEKILRGEKISSVLKKDEKDASPEE